jgi:hypothetical protein
MFSVITNIHNKKTKGPTLKELNRMESIASFVNFSNYGACGYIENVYKVDKINNFKLRCGTSSMQQRLWLNEAVVNVMDFC